MPSQRVPQISFLLVLPSQVQVRRRFVPVDGLHGDSNAVVDLHVCIQLKNKISELRMSMKQQHRRSASNRRVALLPSAARRNCRSYPSLRRSTSVQYSLDTQSARQHNSVFKRELIMGMAVVGIVVRNNDSECGGDRGGRGSERRLYFAHFLFRISYCLALQKVQLLLGRLRILLPFFLVTAGATFIKMLIGEICALPPCYS